MSAIVPMKNGMLFSQSTSIYTNGLSRYIFLASVGSAALSTISTTVAAPAFVNVNDGTNEGLRYVGKNIFTVQYHPEASPGPKDSAYLFDRFLKMMEVND